MRSLPQGLSFVIILTLLNSILFSSSSSSSFTSSPLSIFLLSHAHTRMLVASSAPLRHSRIPWPFPVKGVSEEQGHDPAKGQVNPAKAREGPVVSLPVRARYSLADRAAVSGSWSLGQLHFTFGDLWFGCSLSLSALFSHAECRFLVAKECRQARRKNG